MKSFKTGPNATCTTCTYGSNNSEVPLLRNFWLLKDCTLYSFVANIHVHVCMHHSTYIWCGELSGTQFIKLMSTNPDSLVYFNTCSKETKYFPIIFTSFEWLLLCLAAKGVTEYLINLITSSGFLDFYKCELTHN